MKSFSWGFFSLAPEFFDLSGNGEFGNGCLLLRSWAQIKDWVLLVGVLFLSPVVEAVAVAVEITRTGIGRELEREDR